MKTNAKKRMLISSVAMLLVAMIALGTATFAWFTQNTSATTKNLGVYTSKSSSLEISKSDAVWGSSVDYRFANKKLLPASTAGDNKWFQAVAESEKSFSSAKGEVKTITLDDTTNGNTTYFFKEQLNIRNAGGAAVKDVKIKFTLGNSDEYKYLRVALVPTTAIGKKVADAPAEGTTFANYVYVNNSNNSSVTTGTGEDAVTTYSKNYAAITSVTGDGKNQTFGTTEITPISGDATTGLVTIDVTGEGETLAAADTANNIYAAKYYNLYVWFEGQDMDCYNANAGAVIPEIEFSVEGATVDN